MKKFNKLFILLLISIIIFSITSCDNKNEDNDIKLEKHLITEEDGTYGGTYNLELYGEGSPLNGELDNESVYYTRNDYYNLTSTNTRVNMTYFKSYQQTLAYDDGIACLLMILNNDGETVNQAKEIELVKDYEEFTQTSLSHEGISKDNLKNYITYLGYEVDDSYKDRGSTNNRKLQQAAGFIQDTINEGKIILVKFQEGLVNRWHIILGLETFESTIDGTNRDDVIIFADSFDANDHYQDGYSIDTFAGFWKWWRSVDENGNELSTRDCLVVTPKKATTIIKSGKDAINSNPTKPEKHLLLNLDGTYGGTYNEELYGTINEYNGYYVEDDIKVLVEPSTYNYYAYPDYYNMTSNDTLTILNHYAVFEQTMASSCGPSSLLSVLNYYQYDFSKLNSNLNLKDYSAIQEELVKIYMKNDTNCTAFKNYGGVGVKSLGTIAEEIGYTITYNRYTKDETPCFKSFDEFKEFTINTLKNDQPIVVCFLPYGGHFEVIIGYETMGTKSIYDDVVILADPHDTADNYQDGYNTYPAEKFYARWYNSSCTVMQAYLIINK